MEIIVHILISLGHGTIITSHDKLSHYLSLLTNQFPIESNFVALLADNLNAEISLGTVTNVDEAVKWLSYTYLYVRMRKNPLVYGMRVQDVKDDPLLEEKRAEIIKVKLKNFIVVQASDRPKPLFSLLTETDSKTESEAPKPEPKPIVN